MMEGETTVAGFHALDERTNQFHRVMDSHLEDILFTNYNMKDIQKCNKMNTKQFQGNLFVKKNELFFAKNCAVN